MKKILGTLTFLISLCAANLSFASHTSKEALAQIITDVAPQHTQSAQRILNRVYEKSRFATQHKYGRVFPLVAEEMESLLKKARDKKILEIAGASGENGILFALAGAKKVIINDIDPEEIAAAKTLIQSLPGGLPIQTVCSDCFTLTDTVEPQSIDLIYARNIFHFFNTSQRANFLAMAQKLLRSDGKLVMSVSNVKIYGTEGLGEISLSDHHTFFETHTLMLDRWSSPLGSPQSSAIRSICKSIEDAQNLTSYDNTRLLALSMMYPNGIKYSDAFKDQLHPTFAQFLSEFLAQHKQALLSQYPMSHIRQLMNKAALFSSKTMKSILGEGGFDLVSFYDINNFGHVTQNDAEFMPLLSVTAVKSAQ